MKPHKGLCNHKEGVNSGLIKKFTNAYDLVSVSTDTDKYNKFLYFIFIND